MPDIASGSYKAPASKPKSSAVTSSKVKAAASAPKVTRKKKELVFVSDDDGERRSFACCDSRKVRLARSIVCQPTDKSRVEGPLLLRVTVPTYYCPRKSFGYEGVEFLSANFIVCKQREKKKRKQL